MSPNVEGGFEDLALLPNTLFDPKPELELELENENPVEVEPNPPVEVEVEPNPKGEFPLKEEV